MYFSFMHRKFMLRLLLHVYLIKMCHSRHCPIAFSEVSIRIKLTYHVFEMRFTWHFIAERISLIKNC